MAYANHNAQQTNFVTSVPNSIKLLQNDIKPMLDASGSHSTQSALVWASPKQFWAKID